MKKLIGLFLSLSCLVASAADIDWRNLDMTHFTTNAFLLRGMWGTNSVDGSITNRNQSLGKASIAGTNAVITADSGVAQNFVFVGQTNGLPSHWTRSDGSVFVGKHVATDANLTLFDESTYLWMASIADSNDPPRLAIFMDAIKNGNYDSYGTIDIVAKHDVDGPYSYISMGSGGTNGINRTLQIGIDVGGFNFPYILDVATNSVDIFKIGQDGDLDVIKSVAYSWPTGYGSDTNYVLTDTNKAGALSWQPGLLSTAGTNEIRSLATNVINQNARIGPGTNNVIAKFNVVGGTNVGNSPLYSDTTNYVAQRQRADGGAYTNSATNRIFGMEVSSTTNGYLELVAPNPFGNEDAHIRSMTTGFTGQRPGITMNDAVTFEPITNQLSGHSAGAVLPKTGSIGAGLQLLGSFANPWLDVVATRIHGTTGLSSGPQFGSGVGGTGFGLTTDNTMLQFFRDTGITAAFNKDRNSGQLMLDIAGNGLGFGTGMSNIICGFLTSGLVGLVQVSVTNSSTATPGNHGLMGVQGSGTDKGGGDLRFVGGPSTGTGTNGNVRLQTAEKANSTSSSLNSSFKDRVFVIADPIILTTNSATIVLNATIPTALRGFGGTVIAHTEIENGVDIATTDETFTISANRKGSTVVAGTPSAPITSTSTSGGSAAIANTWSLVANAQSVDLKLTCVTSGIASTNSTVRVTFIPNSSAVPVITHP